MSEKRFYITDTGLGLDTVSGEMYSFGDEEDFCRLFDKLNEQQAIIERLQKKLSECQGHKLELTPIPISIPITLKEAEDSIRVLKYEELFDDE